ncbi:MAG TPA: lysylphosphatidylglycerol synthase transmembrane domain-containing protein [Candidatus Eisenbacteria bacterium]|nr:lysylphosphatidylglycerol synthase transmembrane domain-containing protein [Candidatus Eisenbacteria bacterium]
MALKSRKAWIGGLGVLVAGLLLYKFRGSLSLSEFSGERLWHAVRTANYAYLFLAIVGIYACYAVRALRWKGFQKHIGPAHFWNIYNMNLAGFSAMFLLGRAAEPVRPLLVARKEKVPVSGTFGVYALERILDAACTAVLAAVGLLIFRPSGDKDAQIAAEAFEKGARSAGTVFALIAVVAFTGLIYLRLHGSAFLERRMQGWLTAGHGWRTGFARNLLEFFRGIQTIRSAGDVAAAIFYSVVHWWLVAAVCFLVIRSFGGRLATLTFADAVLVLVFSMVGSAVQLPAVGGGAQALTAFAFMKLYGVEQEAAVAAAMILWLVTFAACSFAGVPLLLREGWRFGDLKRLRQQENAEIDAEIAEPSA